MRENKKDYAIKLLLEEIKYDVHFDTWFKSNETNINAANGAAEYDEDANDWLVRQIENAVDKIYGELAWCAVDNSRFESNEIDEHTPKQWSILLRFSPQWCGSIRSMKSLAHRYVVNRVLFNWYRAGSIPGGEVYQMEAEECLHELYNEARSERVSLEPWRL